MGTAEEINQRRWDKFLILIDRFSTMLTVGFKRQSKNLLIEHWFSSSRTVQRNEDESWWKCVNHLRTYRPLIAIRKTNTSLLFTQIERKPIGSSFFTLIDRLRAVMSGKVCRMRNERPNWNWIFIGERTKAETSEREREKDELNFAALSFLFWRSTEMEMNKKSKTNLLRRLTKKFTSHPSLKKNQSVQTSFDLLKKPNSAKSSDRFVSSVDEQKSLDFTGFSSSASRSGEKNRMYPSIALFFSDRTLADRTDELEVMAH